MLSLAQSTCHAVLCNGCVRAIGVSGHFPPSSASCHPSSCSSFPPFSALSSSHGFPPPASPRHFTPPSHPSHPPRLAPPPTLAPHLIPLPLPDLAPLSHRFLCITFSLLLLLVVLSPFSASFHPRGCFSPFVVITMFVFPSLRRPRSSCSSSTLLLLIDPPPPYQPSSSSLTLLRLVIVNPPPPCRLSSWVWLVLGTRHHLLCLPGMCCHCRCRHRPLCRCHHRHCLSSVASRCWAIQVSSDGLMRDGRKWAATNVVARFHDAPHGPPISWVPPYCPTSPISPLSENKPPTSL